MAQYTTYMNYMIFFSDPAEYQFALGVAGTPFLEMAPRAAATLFGIPHPYPSGDMATISKGITFFFPFTPGAQFFHPGASGIFVDDTLASQLVPGQAGVPASIWPAGPDCLFKWSGTIIQANGNVGGLPTSTTAIPQRRWIGGKEIASRLEGGSNENTQMTNRSSSRTPDGFGKPYRGQNSVSLWTRNVNTYRAGLTPSTSWERFYFRIVTRPATSAVQIWRCHGSPNVNAGCVLKIRTGGDIEIFNVDSAGTEFTKGTIGPFTTSQWVKLDIFMKFATGGGTSGIIRIYVNGVNTFTFTDAVNQGMNQNSSHTQSTLGTSIGTDNKAEIDFDDWICADLPGNVNGTTFVTNEDAWPIDFLMGSHVRAHYVLSGSTTGWTGSFGAMNQAHSPINQLTSQLTSVTSNAQMEGLTDAETNDIQDTFASVLGAVAAIIGSFTSNAANTDGQQGYKKAGGAAVLATIDQISTLDFETVAYLPSGMTIPDEISPWSVVKQKSADANSDATNCLASVVEYIGVWGPEDYAALDLPIDRDFKHNCRYTNTVWGYSGPISDAPVYIVGGTYIGNNTYQEINLPAPVHMLFIRATTGAPTNTIIWFGASIDAGLGATARSIPNLRVWTDRVTGVCKFSVTGQHININNTGQTYQYVAFCDPGMRFSVCGTFMHPDAGSDPTYTNLLPNSNFTPDGGFAQVNDNASGSSTAGLWYRGPSQAGSSGCTLDGTGALSLFGTFGLGQFINADGLNLAFMLDYMLFRNSEPNCSGVMVQMFRYTGNGASPRTITVTPSSGRFPLLAIVMSEGAGITVVRDPTHSGLNSANITSAANTTNGIRGGAIDSITVGSDVNVNAVNYQVFIFPGDTAAWNNGTFFNPNCLGDVSRPTPEPPEEGINVIGDGGLILGDIPGGGTALTLIKDPSGIYTLVTGKRNDTLIDRQSGQTNINVEIPDPTFKTGYVGG